MKQKKKYKLKLRIWIKKIDRQNNPNNFPKSQIWKLKSSLILHNRHLILFKPKLIWKKKYINNKYLKAYIMKGRLLLHQIINLENRQIKIF